MGEQEVEAVVAALIERAGKILVTRQPKWPGKWVLPGGHIEPGEKMMDSIAREMREELGLTVKPLAVVSFGELIYSKDFHRPGHFIFFGMLCEIIEGEVKMDGREVTDYKWVAPEETLGMDVGGAFRKMVKDYMEYKSHE